MRQITLSMLMALLGAACGNEGEAEATHQPTNEPATPADVAEQLDDAPAPATPKVETKTYVAKLSVSSDGDSKLSVGKKAQLLVTIRPQNGWHMNHDFPTSVHVADSEAIAPEKSEVAKQGAKRFDDEGADFVLPVALKQEGEHEAVADLSFAVCTEQTCLPEKLTLALTLDVAGVQEKNP